VQSGKHNARRVLGERSTMTPCGRWAARRAHGVSGAEGLQVQAQAVQTLQACTGAKRMAERALTGGGGRENNLFLTRRTDSPGARHSEFSHQKQ
jgi:hypothetical protein